VRNIGESPATDGLCASIDTLPGRQHSSGFRRAFTVRS
jgi:hypothetical protein